MFIFLVFHQHCKRDRVHCRMFFGRNTSRTVTRNSSTEGIYVCVGGFTFVQGSWHSILTHFTNFVFHISICGGFAHQSPPVATGLTARRSNTFVIKPSGYEFSRFEKYWAAFFIPAPFVLPYITRAGCYRSLPVWKQAWHLNYQQCRLMCS